jgi:hypothetical protein
VSDTRFSTEEMISALNRKTRGHGFADVQEVEIEAIIARLRAADALCEAAKEVDEGLKDYDYDVCSFVMAKLRKAIAEYEEE